MTGREIRTIRKKMGLDQTKFGELLGYKHPQLRMSRIENKEGEIHARLEKIVNMIYKQWRWGKRGL